MTGIKPRTARVVVYQGDDLARLAEYDEAVTRAEVALHVAERKAKDAPSGVPRALLEVPEEQHELMAARSQHEDAVAERDLFAEEAEARGVVVALRSLPRKDWRRLRNAHPPREGNQEDEAFDCNVDSLPDEAIPASVDAGESTIPGGDTEAFLDSLSSHDYYQRLFMTVLALNVGGAVADPKLRVGSANNPTSPATSS